MSNLYMRSDTGRVVTEKERQAVFGLVKLLFRLEIIDEEQALKIATQFQILFV